MVLINHWVKYFLVWYLDEDDASHSVMLIKKFIYGEIYRLTLWITVGMKGDPNELFWKYFKTNHSVGVTWQNKLDWEMKNCRAFWGKPIFLKYGFSITPTNFWI